MKPKKELSTRAIHVLVRILPDLASDWSAAAAKVAAIPWAQLEAAENCGPGTLAEIERWLSIQGHRLAGAPVPQTTSKAKDQEIRKLKRSLKELTDQVMRHLAWLDEEMKKPESEARGKRLAQISNILDMANDAARYHGLEIEFRTDNKDKERARVMRSA